MTATWRAVARKDFVDAVRSRMLWSLIAVFAAFLTMSLLSAEQLFPEAVTVDAPKALAGVAMLAQLFIPGIALVAGYMAVVGERESGSLRVLLGYPFARGDIVFGKLLGRALVTGTALLVGYAVAGAVVLARYGLPDPEIGLGFLGVGVLVGMAFTGLAVGGSAATASRGRAMATTIGAFVGMVFFWRPVIVGLYYLVNGELPGIQADTWYFVLKRLNPLESFRILSEAVLSEPVPAVPKLPLEGVPASATQAQLALANRLGGSVPWYLEDWTAVVVLLAWGTIPMIVGYWRFTRTDLG